MNKKKIVWGLAGVLLIALLVLIIIPSKDELVEEYNLPPDVVELADGSFISLSHFYEMGYLAGTFDVADYISKQNVFKENTKAILDLDTIFDKCHEANKFFFEQYKKTNKYFDEQLNKK